MFPIDFFGMEELGQAIPGQEHYIPVVNNSFSLKESSQPAVLSFLGLLSFLLSALAYRLQMLSANRRRTAIFSAA
jgi:hypothetical protein